MPPAVSLHALALWQPLLDAMLHAVWLMDARALRIVAVNPAAGVLAGVPPDPAGGHRRARLDAGRHPRRRPAAFEARVMGAQQGAAIATLG